jgi:hypothetical protein
MFACTSANKRYFANTSKLHCAGRKLARRDAAALCISYNSFFFGYATTQLALQVQQERTQVVCSNKEARKRLAEALPQWTMDLMASACTSTQIKEK